MYYAPSMPRDPYQMAGRQGRLFARLARAARAFLRLFSPFHLGSFSAGACPEKNHLRRCSTADDSGLPESVL